MKSLAPFALLAAMASPLSAAIVIAGDVNVNGAPCTLTITTDVTFTLTRALQESAICVVLPNYTVSDNDATFLVLTSDIQYSLNGGPTIVAFGSRIVDNLAGNYEDMEPNDTYFFFTPQSDIAIGESITIKAGIYSFQGSTAFNPATVGTYTGDLFIADGDGAALSPAVTVPEPSAALLGAVGALALLRRRRH